MKGRIKIKLSTTVLSIIIFILIIALGIVYYIGFVRLPKIQLEEVVALNKKIVSLQSEKEKLIDKINNSNEEEEKDSDNKKEEIKEQEKNQYNEDNTTNTSKTINPENFKKGWYTYSFESENGVESSMTIGFKEDNTVVFVPPHSNGLYLTGTYKIEYQEEPGMYLPGNIYAINCNIDKWTFEPSGDIDEEALSPGTAYIVILDEENIMIENMNPIKLSNDVSRDIYFGEGVKFTLEK